MTLGKSRKPVIDCFIGVDWDRVFNCIPVLSKPYLKQVILSRGSTKETSIFSRHSQEFKHAFVIPFNDLPKYINSHKYVIRGVVRYRLEVSDGFRT